MWAAPPASPCCNHQATTRLVGHLCESIPVEVVSAVHPTAMSRISHRNPPGGGERVVILPPVSTCIHRDEGALNRSVHTDELYMSSVEITLISNYCLAKQGECTTGPPADFFTWWGWSR